MTATISFITTVRIGDEARRHNLEAVLAWYQRMSGWEIVVVEQDEVPRLDSDAWAPEIRRVFVRNPGPFNKNWGYNVGVRVARSDVLFFCDADLLIEHSALATAAGLCARRSMAVNPYDRIADLDEAESKAVAAGLVEPDFTRPDASTLRGMREQLCFCGGAFFMRRALHHLMGGFDERFVGWGAEDDANTVRMRRVAGAAAATGLENRCALHLWHARDELVTFGNPHYPDNVQRLRWATQADDAELRFLCDVQRQIMGHPGKYERAAG
jgi:glycosyltransferase involved in cell wall biosynthesis